ncbi:MAG TPA: DUF642 domain-containing protein, partial [Planctomycetaceae bacterium]|nr:DUF642 domain-containing protein [Planctomycetaceae bacterium]
DFQLVHDTPQGWVTKDQRQPPKLTEGKHTIRVALRTHEGPRPISNAITIGVGPHKLVPEPGENDPNRAVRAASATQFEIKPVENPQPVEEASVGLFHNGGFETPDHYNSLYNVYFPGPLGAWKVERGSVEIVTKYWTPAEGEQSLDLSGFQNQPGTISQEIITVPGRKYRIRFSAAANPEPDDVATLKQLKVFWGESESKTLEFDAKGYDFKNVGWKVYEFEAVATGKKTRLAFESLTTSPCGPILDDISVVQISE